MAAASTTGSEPVKVDSKKIVPTLLRIERSKGYLPGSDKHYKYAYLAERLVTGMERNKLESKKLSQMYSVFENQHGLLEAIALVSFLFRVCDDTGSAEEIEALVSQSDSGLRFCGRRVSEEEREKFNIRTLFARLAAELDEAKQEDFISMLRSHIEDSESKNTHFKTILVLMTKACNSGVLTAQNLSAQLQEWLELLGFSEDGDLSIMKEITNFDSKKPFPGMIIIKQRSTDSAFEEDYDHAYYEQQSRLHHHQNPPDNSVESYDQSNDSLMFSRARAQSTEEVGPPSSSEMVASSSKK